MTPKPRCSVTWAIAEITSIGSLAGTCAPARTERRFRAAGIDVVDADHVGDEQAVEETPLQQSGQVCPISQLLVAPGLAFGMLPGPRHQMRRVLMSNALTIIRRSLIGNRTAWRWFR